MSEEVAQDLSDTAIHGAKFILNVRVDSRLGGQVGYLRQSITDGQKNAVNLSVFVDEQQGVGDVVVAHVDDTGADPGSNTFLCLVQDGVHHARRFGSGLYSVETLPSVT